jgi:hypothetical protein
MKSVLALLVLVACGDNKQPADIVPDAPIPMPDAWAEAPHAMPPTVMNEGGSVLAAPKVQPIFFSNEDSQSTLEQFLTQMAGSPYWTTTTSEYGVGALTILPSVVWTDTPPTTDTALQTLLAAKYPTPDAATIYTVFLPGGVVLDQGGGSLSCKAFGGYHSETNSGLVYALIPRCASPAGWQPLDETTVATSHELIEASTDPHFYMSPAYDRVDQDHYIWNRTPGAELGDMCEYVETAPQPLVGTFMVQRTWSNAAAAAGKDPCVPEMANGYIAAAPHFTDADVVTVNSRQGAFSTSGVTVNNGMSVDLQLDVFADVDTTDTVSVEVMDAGVFTGTGAPQLAYQLGSYSGGNGSTLDLMITRTKAGTGRSSEFVVVTKRAGKIVALWWGLAAGM